MNKPHPSNKPSRLQVGLSGALLVSELRKRGITKYRLAKELGISYRSVQYWAKGKVPSLAMADRIAAHLGVPVEVGHDEDWRRSIDTRLDRIEAELKTRRES